ncbi:MAG TPA: glycosyltransferase family 4 protein [Coriobacteriia bacterium]|jgi:polysaccharide biosynthesis protein PelF
MRPRSVLFAFGWLVVGGEETEVRLLARLLDRARYRLEVVACLRREGMPDQTERQLAELGIAVDKTPYSLSFEDTIEYLAGRVGSFDLVVACQAVPDIAPALRLAASRGVRVPPLIEHGGLVVEAEQASDLAARYVGVCDSIRAAAARRMVGREDHALEIPSMVDLDEFDPAHRRNVRRELGFGADEVVFGWVGRLDRKKRVEDFVRAAALLRQREPRARFVVVGGPDAFMPEYEDELRRLAKLLRLGDRLRFLGDRADVPRLLAGLDAMVWLARGEGMPHVIVEAGAASLPVIATQDDGTLEQIRDEVTGLFVPHEQPLAVAASMQRLARDPRLRRRLGAALRRDVEARYATAVIVPRWERLFDEVIDEHIRDTVTV